MVDELVVALAGKERDDLAFTSPTDGLLRNRNARALSFEKAAFEDDLDAVADRLDAVAGPRADFLRTSCGLTPN
jgi:hypothetical protein